MKTKTEPFLLSELNELREKINTKSDYQRPEVWKRSQKQLLIDSILRGYDIPKIYVKQEDPNSQYAFEVVDGQQRLVAIWGYFNGDFALSKDAEPINGGNCASQGYEDLEMDLRKAFDNYSADVVIVTEAIQTKEKNEIGELFLRLQNGSPLNAQEKRNAMPGKMRDFIKKLANHKFFESCQFSNTRYAYDAIAAQLICLELSLVRTNRPCNIGGTELDKMYEEQKKFDMNGEIVKQVKEKLDYLEKTFPNKTPELIKHNIITLYCLVSKLSKFDGAEQQLHNWFIEFEAERAKNNELKDGSEKDIALIGYAAATSNAADKYQNIEKRLALMQKKLFSAVPELARK